VRFALSVVWNALPWLILLSPVYVGLGYWLFGPEQRRSMARWGSERVVLLWLLMPVAVVGLLRAVDVLGPYLDDDPFRPGAPLLTRGAAVAGGAALSAAVLLPVAVVAASYVWRRGPRPEADPPED
jgi:hypothetical protein